MQTRPGNVSARILKRNQFATSARYLAASSALIIAIYTKLAGQRVFSFDRTNAEDRMEKNLDISEYIDSFLLSQLDEKSFNLKLKY